MSSEMIVFMRNRANCLRVCIVCVNTASCSGRSVSVLFPKDN
jgi:hypothetical protein